MKLPSGADVPFKKLARRLTPRVHVPLSFKGSFKGFYKGTIKV